MTGILNPFFSGTPTGPGWTYSGKIDIPAGVAADHTFTGFTAGAPAANRVIVVCLFWGNPINSTLGSVIIGGVAGTELETNANSGSSDERVSMWYAVVPTGTTVDVETIFTLNSPSEGIVCIIYYGRPIVTTPTGHAQASAFGTAPFSVGPIAVEAGGILIALRVGVDGRPAAFTISTGDTLTVVEEANTSPVNWSHVSLNPILTASAAATVTVDTQPGDIFKNGVVIAAWGA